ncbi:MAG TPA: universal stress protein [Gemmatimonadaceae bacterium]|nr:universal stress protein [Gemmatimonadaceae bacterium]
MYRTLIVPLDGSPFAERAVATAAAIAKQSHAELALARVHEAYLYETTDYSRVDDHSRRDQEEYLARVAEGIETTIGIQPRRVLLEGVIPLAISEFASSVEEPLIVMSTHGRTGFSRLWLGSVADALLRYLSTPVLMLRHQASGLNLTQPHRFENVLVPLDGSDVAELALTHAAALARPFGATLTLLRVVAPAPAPVALYAAPFAAPALEQFDETLRPRIDEAGDYVNAVAARLHANESIPTVRTDVRVSESTAPAILDTAAAHNADTIAIVTHGRGLSRLVSASVADKLLRAGPDAVLVLRASPAP